MVLVQLELQVLLAQMDHQALLEQLVILEQLDSQDSRVGQDPPDCQAQQEQRALVVRLVQLVPLALLVSQVALESLGK